MQPNPTYINKFEWKGYIAVLPTQGPLHQPLVNQLLEGTTDESCIVVSARPQMVDGCLQKRA